MKNPFRRHDNPVDETEMQINVLLDYIDHLETENIRLKKQGDTVDDFHVIIDIDPAKQTREYKDTWGGSHG